MEIFMPKDQKDVVISILKNTNNYLEFGSGGSTVAASKYIKGRGYSIESEEEWSKKVEKETKDNITMFYIDIENIKHTWGHPGKNCPKYKMEKYSKIHNLIKLDDIDTILIDGRFRVSCALQIHDHIKDNAIIIFDDFFGREDSYGEILNYYSIYERINHMALMKKKNTLIPKNIYEKYLYDFM
uniref:Methyltransferase n=1 Tax=viral metagenome TaxID=1070528 RepID=A0A6C0KYD9_9ZZZZ|tara:strand:- start:7338 stop:7889 length:552 start_codon:yes stop_codon:yes gene_type:complete